MWETKHWIGPAWAMPEPPADDGWSFGGILGAIFASVWLYVLIGKLFCAFTRREDWPDNDKEFAVFWPVTMIWPLTAWLKAAHKARNFPTATVKKGK